MRETVEIDMGPAHLVGLETIVDPIVVSELPTVLWSPARARRGGQRAARDHRRDPARLRRRVRCRTGTRAGARRSSRTSYVVDLAWLRTTPWRERLAASFDPPARRRRAGGDRRLHDPPPGELERERAAARRLAGLAAAAGTSGRSRRQRRAALRRTGLHGGRRATSTSGSRRSTRTCPGSPASPCPARRLHAVARPRRRRAARPRDRSPATASKWQVLGASRGEGGILGEGVRQALLRDPTYGPALSRGQGVHARMRLRSRSSTIPAGRARRCWSGRPPAAAHRAHRRIDARAPRTSEFVDAVRTVGVDVSEAHDVVRRRALRRARRRALELRDGEGGDARAARRAGGCRRSIG